MNDQKTTPVKKTPSRGRYMDFAPRRSSAMVVERKKVVRKITITTHADHIDAETQKINEALTRTVKPQKKPVAKPVVKPASKPALKSKERTPEEVTMDELKSLTTNNSPFLSSVTVDKRPLSAGRERRGAEISSIKEEDFVGPSHNVYAPKDEPKATKTETRIVDDPTNHSRSIGLIVAVLVTIVLGAAAGAGIYLLFFA